MAYNCFNNVGTKIQPLLKKDAIKYIFTAYKAYTILARSQHWKGHLHAHFCDRFLSVITDHTYNTLCFFTPIIVSVQSPASQAPAVSTSTPAIHPLPSNHNHLTASHSSTPT